MWLNKNIPSLIFLARLCGKLVGMFARTQTRLLTAAQHRGWQMTDLEVAKLQRRQFQLFNFTMAKAQMKKQKGKS